MACHLNAQAILEELLRDDFDRYNSQTWGTAPVGAEIVFRNQLNQTNGSIRMNPRAGGCYIISDEMFREASMEFEVKVNSLSTDSTNFYYFGFHNTQPWTRDLLWLVVQDSSIKLQARENGGAFFEQQIGNIPFDRWVKFVISRKGKQVVVEMDGRAVLDLKRPEFSDSPMSAFFGANTISGSKRADLQVDSVQVNGDPALQAAALRETRLISEEEKVIASRSQSVSGGDWEVVMHDGEIRLSNPEASYAFSLLEGIQWSAVDRREGDGSVPAISPGTACPLYVLRAGDQNLDSRDFPLEEVSVSPGKPRFEVVQYDPTSGLSTRFEAELRDDSSLGLSLEVTNRSGVEQVLQTTFPVLQNIEIDGKLDNLNYFFPWRGGLLGTVASSLATEYGGLGWMQVMAVFNSEARSGIFFYPEDATGTTKGLMLKKAFPGSEDRVNFSEVLYPEEMPSINLAPSSGMGMAVYYKRQALQPGGAIAFPTTRLKAYDGDWREPLDEYVAWTREWYRPVKVPRWFKESYTFLNQHPQSYYDNEKDEYIGARALVGSEHVVQWAFWESLKVPHVGPNYNGHPEYQPGDFVPSIHRGGLATFNAEIAAYRAKGTRFVPYINYRFCLRASEVGTQHTDWAAIRKPGGDYIWSPWPEENLNMCFYDQDKWAAFIASTTQRLVRDTGMSGIYLDELPLQHACFNPAHRHLQNGSPTSKQDMAESLTMVRDAMKAADPQAVLWTEHVGSDYMSQFIDGSWTQTYCRAFPFTEKYFDANRLVYFRFLFPSVKLAEWGSSERHINRYFFNGMGWDFGTGDRALSRVLGNILKANSDAIQTMTPEPLVPTSHPGLLANRFDAPGKIVYTLYNVHDQGITAFISEPAPFEGHYVELVDDVEISPDGTGQMQLTMAPETVKAVVLLRNILEVSQTGGKVVVSVPEEFASSELLVYADVDDSHLLSSKGIAMSLNDGSAEFTVEQTFDFHPRRLIIKLQEDGYLQDQRVLVISPAG